jgi:WD40 repeat-containing protein SMU1
MIEPGAQLGVSPSLSIAAEDVMKVMLQYLKENNLMRSFEVLQEESGVSLNTVESQEGFAKSVQQGKWDVVLPLLSTMRLPREKLVLVYEQVVFELLESGERELAREFLRTTPSLTSLRTDEPQRFSRLEHLCQKTAFNPVDVYEFKSSSGKELRRQEIAEALASEVSVAESQRLLVLLGQALKYQQLNGLLPAHATSFDLFRNSRKVGRRDTDDKVVKRLAGTIKFAPESHPETACFSPDGASLVTGSIDGFVEVWDYEACSLRKDLAYQARDELMAHEAGEAVLCSAFSRDSEHLVTGSKNGQLKLWKLSTGVCLRRFAQAHPQGITSVCFSRDGTQLLSTSFDHSARVHGIKSGRTLKLLEGHSSYVNTACFSHDGAGAITGSSDGTVKIWDLGTQDCTATVRPGSVLGAVEHDHTVLLVQLLPQTPENVLVVSKSSTAYILDASSGETLRSIGGSGAPDFLCATLSPRGRWTYAVREDGALVAFDTLTGTLEEEVAAVPKGREAIALAHHPHRNFLVLVSDDGQLAVWRA